MEARFMAFFVVFICVFTANNSEGRNKLGDNILDDGVKGIHEHEAEQAWDFCKKELKDSTESVKDLGSAISHSRTLIENGVEFGSPCSANTPRRYLGTRRRVLGIPAPPGDLAPSPSEKPDTHYPPIPGLKYPPLPDFKYPPLPDVKYPSLTEAKYPESKTEKVEPGNNNNVKYLIAAMATGVLAGLGLVAIVIYLCLMRDRRLEEPNDGLRDEKPLLNLSPSNMSAGSSQQSHIMSTPINLNSAGPSTTVSSSLDAAHCVSPQAAAVQPTEAPTEPVVKNTLPLPPGRVAVADLVASFETAAAAPAAEAAAPPPPVAKPPPAPPTLPTPVPPPPPRGGRRPSPPNPPGPSRPSPLGPHHRRNSSGDSSVASDESEAPKTKLKPFFWDKVLANPDQSMVWHELKAGSFQFNEEMMEALFGYAAADKKKTENRKGSSSESTPQFIQIIDAKKAQNLAILLKALNVTTEEVCDALKEGNELPAEFIQTLLKMAPTADEELKLKLYSGDLSQIGPAERFLKGVVDIPFAFKRMESLLFMSTFQEELSSIKGSLATLQVACTELRSSRLFLKLLEAVLKTGNRMNDGTYRGGAQAFKLETLLKLSDVKGTDGKTTLLHFVVHEIIRGEGARAARKLQEGGGGSSISSVMTEDLYDDSSHETEEYHRNLGLQVVSGLSDELKNVKKAALIDNDMLSESVSKLSQARMRTKAFLEKEMKDLGEESEFFQTLTSFVSETESDVTWLIEEEKRIMNMVKRTGDYFHGKGGREEAVHLFIIVRDFLVMVDKTCLNMKNSIKLPTKVQQPKNAVPSLSQESPSQSPAESARDLHHRLFPALKARRVDDDDEFSSDDDS